MKQKVLIINADDCNLTSQVTEAILKAHANGIVTSTTFMVNLPANGDVVRELNASKNLGVGLHLNVTLGEPAAKASLVKSLLQKDGRFKKKDQYAVHKFPPAVEIAEEFKAQLQRFVKLFKHLPTHVDVHHHMHDHRPFFEALAGIVKKHNLPIRWTRLLNEREIKQSYKFLKTTDHFFGNLDPHTFWTEEVLRHLLFTLPEGTNEVMCHPGWVDDELCAISSLTIPREREYQLFSLKELRKYIAHLGITLTNFGFFSKSR
ncbi:MAG TPA: ChbG/HpnK family deacetylase [Candidatus Omnitrophota bacterium]|nr:ChbG/HpnK family deacetylase [Candidatus Omnitrophota bacterium]